MFRCASYLGEGEQPKPAKQVKQVIEQLSLVSHAYLNDILSMDSL